jgi:hypothetical protein
VKTLSAFIFVWGLVCILTVVVEDYRGLVVQRVFLGLTEVSPGVGLHHETSALCSGEFELIPSCIFSSLVLYCSFLKS